MEYILPTMLAGLVSAIAIMAWSAKKRDKIIAKAPICEDCIHATYLSSHDDSDRWDWGVVWSSDSGYYCKLSEYKISSGGAVVTGFDKKRMRKCESVRDGKCGIRGKLFEAKPD